MIALLASLAEGGWDGKTWTIIVALATAVAAEAGYIRFLVGRMNASQDATIKKLEDQLSMVRTAKGEVKEEKKEGAGQ